jgi:hypothetical protein
MDRNNALMVQSTVWASLLDARQLPLGPIQRIVTPGPVPSGPPNGTGAGLTRGAIARISQAQDGCLFPIEMKRAMIWDLREIRLLGETTTSSKLHKGKIGPGGG